MVRPIWAPGLNGPAEPNTARVRDYWLGGSHHSAIDRELADEFIVCAPHLPYLVRIQREFLRRAVRFLAESGMRQFLDLGSGLPTVGNVHEVAQGVAPDARVVYVDIDPVVADEGRQLLAGTPGTAFVNGDIRQPERILDAAAELLDFSKPVAVLVLDVLHFIRDEDDPVGVVRTYVEHTVPGSMLALTHTALDEGLLAAIRLFDNLYGAPPELTFRDAAKVAEFCAGLELAEPGIAPIPLWRPDSTLEEHRYPENFQGYAAVAVKR